MQMLEIPGYIGNGRQLYKANPPVMGSWMLDAGFQHGLTIRNIGGQDSAPAMASIVWVPFKAKAKAPEPVVAKTDEPKVSDSTQKMVNKALGKK